MAIHDLLVEFLEEGDAPLATGAGAEAIAGDGGERGFLTFIEIDDFAHGNAETEADVVIGVHDGSVWHGNREKSSRLGWFSMIAIE